MLDGSAAYRAAVVGDHRRVLLRAVVDVIDPDIVYGPVEGDAAPVCVREQIYDKKFTLEPYGTLEPDRWLLDGSMRIFPDNPQKQDGQAGYLSQALSGADGTFSPAAWVELRFANVSILQACAVYFPVAEYDGVPDTFTVEVKQGGTSYFSKSFSGNRAASVFLDGFTVHDPDAIRVTATRWSRPGRRLRLAEIVPGIYESWDSGHISEFHVVHQVNFSCLALPFGTCTLSMDNRSRRFDPRSKHGVFASLEERQGIDVSLGMALPDGSAEYQRLGVFYQYSGGWRTGDNGLSIRWDLVDILGLLADRQYLPPEASPTTLEGWVASLVGQLGVNFARRYTVDPGYAALPLNVNALADVSGKSCGEILRWACMATGTFPRADARTGFLAVEPLWRQGGSLTLDNLEAYPVIKANDDLAAVIFTLFDGSEGGTQLVVSGNTAAAGNTVSVQNPFLHTPAQALAAARLILSTYGGNLLETSGRGDPSSEVGDVDTVWLDASGAVSARRMQQSFQFSGGVLQGCRSVLLQADGAFLFERRAVITKSGTWTAPAGVDRLRMIVVGGGAGGDPGQPGTWEGAGEPGTDGPGGLVWYGVVDINPEQAFQVEIGRGGAPGQPGTATVFGAFSSADGRRFEPSYTDSSGGAYARTGVSAPADGTGDGGKGGAGGVQGNRHEESFTFEGGGGFHMVVDNEPGPGAPGTSGASGCVVIYWDKGA